MSWVEDLQALTTKGGHDLGRLAKAIKISAFSDIVENTRVDTGRLKGNWNIQDDVPDLSTSDRTDKEGKAVIAEIRSKSTEDGKTYFTNSLPYAKKYEDIDGMVGQAAVRMKQNVADEVRKIRNA